jgi:uracil-DNA glycosylase
MGEGHGLLTVGEEAAAIIQAVNDHLKYQGELGLAGLDGDLLRQAYRQVRQAGGHGRLNPAEALREIRQELGECTRCPLHQGRTNIVFGEGDPFARCMFIGEGPGEDEDAQGLPFVGRAGQLLTDIIVKGMRIQRSEVYIANVVKCRPAGNRDPEPAEIEKCLPFLIKQIEAIEPRVIVLLGRVAANALVSPGMPISRVRGVWHEFNGIPVMPTFHPSYLLRNPAAKREVWADIKNVMEKLGLAIEEKK